MGGVWYVSIDGNRGHYGALPAVASIQSVLELAFGTELPEGFRYYLIDGSFRMHPLELGR